MWDDLISLLWTSHLESSVQSDTLDPLLLHNTPALTQAEW